MSIKKNLSIENSKYILLSVQIGEKIIMIERNNNWEINITKTAKLFNKRLRNRKKRNTEVIQTFEALEG